MNPPLLWLRPWLWLGGFVVLGVLLWLLGPVLTPFAVAALLAWVADPLVSRIERSGRSRGTAVTLVFLLMTLLVTLVVLLLVPMLKTQVERAIEWGPKLGTWITGTAIPWVEARFDVSIAAYVDPAELGALLKEHWQQAGGVAANVIGGLSKSGLALLALVANLLLIPLVTFYFMRDWRSMIAAVHELVPRPLEPTVVRLARESDDVLGGFLRGQVSVMIALGVIYGVGLSLIGLDLGFLIGMIAGLLSFVPYLGTAIGLIAAVIATLVEHGDLFHLVLVCAVFGGGQVIEGFVLTPWLVGDRIGLHPVAVIFAIMAGGQLFGFLGILLALPAAAVIMVLLRYAHERYTQSLLYREDRDGDGVVEGASEGEVASASPVTPSPRDDGDTRPA
ncbi:MAG: AI-2E family transporter [Silanimonas sp.]